ncbi:MAG TPA: C40 family peptidase, partial [Spirillospora sp.]|nr:C40 family peptidase [Spirillospora sp.]
QQETQRQRRARPNHLRTSDGRSEASINGPAQGRSGITPSPRFQGIDSLTQYAWAQAGIQLPRVAAAQYTAGPHIPRTQLKPGDLLFFATDTRNPATIHHVGLYYGRGQMIHAPQTGDVVRISPFTGNPYRERQYIGATRPSTSHSTA